METSDPLHQSDERSQIPPLTDAVEAMAVREKLEHIQQYYEQLMASQLETQRTHYEGQLDSIREGYQVEMENACVTIPTDDENKSGGGGNDTYSYASGDGGSDGSGGGGVGGARVNFSSPSPAIDSTLSQEIGELAESKQAADTKHGELAREIEEAQKALRGVTKENERLLRKQKVINGIRAQVEQRVVDALKEKDDEIDGECGGWGGGVAVCS